MSSVAFLAPEADLDEGPEAFVVVLVVVDLVGVGEEEGDVADFLSEVKIINLCHLSLYLFFTGTNYRLKDELFHYLQNEFRTCS